MRDDHNRLHPAGPMPWIDALRGLAILMVLANHVALVVPGLSAPLEMAARFGQMGVQLFFVVSAYTLCLSWQQRRTGEPQPLLRFALRRLCRIAPLYWLGIALFAGIHFAQPGPTAAEPFTAAHVAANVFFVHGFVPAANNVIVPGGWSIGTEMAFYALFPLLMAGLARRPGAAPALAAAALAVGLHLALQAARPEPLANNSFGYFHLLNQLPVFLIGIALFQWHRLGAGRVPAGAALGIALGALAATAWLWRSGLASAFVGVPVVAALAFAAGAHAARQLAWAPRLLQALGRRSYAIYIVHLLFAWHGLRALDALWPLHGDLAYLLALAAATAASQFAAAVLGRWVEAPGIALGRQLIARLPLAPRPPGTAGRIDPRPLV
jgi:peptidoglycan/LPS O-acetylase OafA/YrhL